jgi:hypothetical protein
MKPDHPSPQSYEHAAWLLMAETRSLRAVASVECGPEGGFLDTGEPVILFERHIFHRLTGARYDVLYPQLSNPMPGEYGSLRSQHQRLQAAASLNRDAALQSCSWGLFQLMGMNHRACGYPQLQRFVTAMYRSVDDHLRAFAMFIRSDDRLVDSLRKRDWRSFAYVYNGPAFEKNKYDKKMAEAYERLGQEA